MKRIVVAVVLASFVACTQTSESQPVKVAPKLATLVVTSGGVELGTIKIPAGQLGTLTATSAPGAKKLIEDWAQIQKDGAVMLDFHEKTKDGKRGAHGTRVIRPTAADYAESVRLYLKHVRNFEVAMK